MLLDIYPKELKTCPHKNLHMDVYSLFVHICPKLELTKMSSTDKQINKPWCIQKNKYYSELKTNNLSSHEKNIKYILLCERQPGKAIYCYQLYGILEKANYGISNRSVVAKGWLEEGMNRWHMKGF